MATPVAAIAHQVNLVLGIEDHEREVVLGGKAVVYVERWVSVRCNRHPIAVMRAIGWRCPHYLAGTSADRFIYQGCPVGELDFHSYALHYSLDAMEAVLHRDGSIVIPWHTFSFEMGRQHHLELSDIQEFFFNVDFGVRHLLDTQERLLDYGLDRFPLDLRQSAAPLAAATAVN